MSQTILGGRGMNWARRAVTSSHLRSSRHARWLVAAALACMVGLYSLQVTHLHHSTKTSLAYPKSQVERPALLDGLLPNLAPIAPFQARYHLTLPEPGLGFAADSPRLTPQGRAPPFLYS